MDVMGSYEEKLVYLTNNEISEGREMELRGPVVTMLRTMDQEDDPQS